MPSLFDPTRTEPYRVSRSKLQLFLDCAHCFYLDRRLGISRPPSAPYTLNNTVDILLKREFDVHRAEQTPHSIMTLYGVDAVPFAHPQLDTWRDSLHGGIEVVHAESNLLLTGAVDDVWQHSDESLIVVDYKATSTDVPISADTMFEGKRQSNARQLEVYQWLLHQQGFNVNEISYLLVANAKKNATQFDAKLNFSLHLVPHTGSYDWVHDALVDAKQALLADSPPPSTEQCVYCGYRRKN